MRFRKTGIYILIFSLWFSNYSRSRSYHRRIQIHADTFPTPHTGSLPRPSLASPATPRCNIGALRNVAPPPPPPRYDATLFPAPLNPKGHLYTIVDGSISYLLTPNPIRGPSPPIPDTKTSGCCKDKQVLGTNR